MRSLEGPLFQIVAPQVEPVRKQRHGSHSYPCRDRGQWSCPLRSGQRNRYGKRVAEKPEDYCACSRSGSHPEASTHFAASSTMRISASVRP